MARFQIIGIVALVVGVVLLVFGYHASNAPVEQLSNTFLGHYTHETMWYLVGGAAAAVLGLGLVLSGSRR
jgi:drug/metabolite transporter (DMT)-like permease